MDKQKYLITIFLLLFAIMWAVRNAEVNPQQNVSLEIYPKVTTITIPKMLNYQGKLTNLTGVPVPDSQYSITFRLHSTAIGSNIFWSETQLVQTINGIFNVILGSVAPIETIPQSGNCYLEMQVNPNPPMSPRIRIVSSAYAYLAKKADTADYALATNIIYVDSARIATNAYKLQGKDTLSLSNKFIDEGQLASGDLTGNYPNPIIANNAITSAKIQDATIIRQDVNSNFKAPFADTADFARAASVQYVDSARISANTYKLQGKDTTALSNKFVDEGQTAGGDLTSTYPNPIIATNAVTTTKILNNTILREDVASIFKAPFADTADYVRNVNIQYVDSARISANTYKLQGKDTTALSNKFVDEGQVNAITNAMISDNAITSIKIQDGSIQISDLSFTPVTRPITPGVANTEIQDNAITSSKIQDGTILRQDVVPTFKAPYADTSDYARNIPVISYVDSSRISVNSYNAYKLQGKDTTNLDTRYVNEGQPNSIISAMIIDGTITRTDVASNFKAPYADTADYARFIPGSIDSARIAANAHKLQGKDTTSLDTRYVNEAQTNSVSSGMIQDGSVTNTKLAPNSVSTDKILNGTIQEDDIANSAITTDKIDRNAVTTNEIKDSTIIRADVHRNFKAPYADTADFARVALVLYVDSARISANAHKLQGKDTLALSAKFIDEAQTAGGDLTGTYPNPIIANNTITTDKIVDNNVTNDKIAAGITDTKLSGTGNLITNLNADLLDGQHASEFLSTTNDYGRSGVAGSLYEGTTTLTDKYVNEAQPDAITSPMIQDGTIIGNDFALPCTLSASVSVAEIGVPGKRPKRSKSKDIGAVLNVMNNGTGDGVCVIQAGRNGFFVNRSNAAGFVTGVTEQDGINLGYSGWDAIYAWRALWHGVEIDSAGLNGIFVNTAGQNGLSVNNASENGVAIFNANQDGINVNHATWDGLYVNRANIDGVYIESAGDNGFKVNNAVKGFTVGYASEQGVVVDSTDQNGILVFRAGHNGVHINQAHHNGYSVARAEYNGLYVDSVIQNGVQITHANNDGILINSADNYGVNATGNVAGANFQAADVDGSIGLIVNARQNDADSTAIYAYGKGLATGGWETATKDGPAPCIISPNSTIITYGQATLNKGTITIDYPKMFKNNIRSDVPVSINLTPLGNPQGLLYVSELKASSFRVELKQIPGWDGDSNITFSWLAIGTLKETSSKN